MVKMKKILGFIAIIIVSAIVFASCASNKDCDCSRWSYAPTNEKSQPV